MTKVIRARRSTASCPVPWDESRGTTQNDALLEASASRPLRAVQRAGAQGYQTPGATPRQRTGCETRAYRGPAGSADISRVEQKSKKAFIFRRFSRFQKAELR